MESCGSRLLWRKLKQRLGDNGEIGFLMLYGRGLCLMDGDAERAVRMDGSIVVMVEFDFKRDRDKKQREEE